MYIACQFIFLEAVFGKRVFIYNLKWILGISHKDLKYLPNLLTELALPWRSVLTYFYLINTEDGSTNMETTITLMLTQVILLLIAKMINLHSLHTPKVRMLMMNMRESLGHLLGLEMKNMMISLNNKLLF